MFHLLNNNPDKSKSKEHFSLLASLRPFSLPQIEYDLLHRVFCFMAVCECVCGLNTFIHSLHSLRLSLFSLLPPLLHPFLLLLFLRLCAKTFWQYNANCCDDVTSVDLICNDTISSRQRSCPTGGGAQCRKGVWQWSGGVGSGGRYVESVAQLCALCSTHL